MRIIRAFSLTIALALCFGGAYAQTTKVATISSSYPVTIPAGTMISISTVSMGVSYPIGLTPGSYVSGTQLNTDFQGFLSAYPSLTDPPEAILSSVLQSILNKYPQMTGGSLSGEIAGPPTMIGGITIPNPTGGGFVDVIISNALTGVTVLNRRQPKSKPGSAH
jgi:hypothetical protein